MYEEKETFNPKLTAHSSQPISLVFVIINLNAWSYFIRILLFIQTPEFMTLALVKGLSLRVFSCLLCKSYSLLFHTKLNFIIDMARHYGFLICLLIMVMDITVGIVGIEVEITRYG